MSRAVLPLVSVGLVVAATCWSIVVDGRAPTPQAPPRIDEAPVIFRATTALVQIDALVVGPGGAPLTTLSAGDFEVRQDGQPVAVRDVTFVDRAAAQRARQKRPALVRRAPA